MSYKCIIIDAKSLFRRFLFEIRNEQLMIYKTSDKIGNVIPINHYILVFDTIIRLLLRMNNFTEKIKKFFAKKLIDKAPVYLSMCSEQGWFINRLDTRYAKKSLDYKNFQDELYKVISTIYKSQDAFNEPVLEYCEFLCQVFGFHIPFDGIEITLEQRNKIVKHFIYLVMLYQTSLTNKEITYVYEVMCRYSGLKLIGRTTAKTVTNSIFITDSKRVNSYEHCIVVDTNLHAVVMSEPDGSKLSIKLHTPLRIPLFKQVCDNAVHQVIKMNDDTYILALSNTKSTYINKVPIPEMSSTVKAKSISHCDYTSLKVIFLKIINDLLIDEQKELRNLL